MQKKQNFSLKILLLFSIIFATAEPGGIGQTIDRDQQPEEQHKKLTPAEKVAEENAKILEQVKTIENEPKSIKTAYEMQRLAFNLEGRLRDRNAARKLYQESLAIFDQEIGSESPQSIPILMRLADLVASNKEFELAETFYKRAIKSAEASFAPNDSHLAKIYDAMAKFYTQQKKWTEAETAEKKEVQIYQKVFESVALESATAQNQLSETYFSQRKFHEAEQPLLDAIASYSKTMGPNSILIAGLQDSLADVYMRQKKFAEAEKAIKKSLFIKESALGTNSEYLMSTLNKYASLLEATGRLEEAKQSKQRADQIDQLYPEKNRSGLGY
jgi:Tetratricopeptide repeat